MKRIYFALGTTTLLLLIGGGRGVHEIIEHQNQIAIHSDSTNQAIVDSLAVIWGQQPPPFFIERVVTERDTVVVHYVIRDTVVVEPKIQWRQDPRRH